MADLETLAATKRTHAEGAAPATPSAGEVVVYAKTDGNMYQKDDAGTETSLAGAGGGSVATDAIFDAKGDLAGGTGADTAAALSVGANDTVLTADSGEATGMKWAAAAAFKGAKVYHSTTQTIATSTHTATLFNSETFDTDTLHSTVSNTSRITIDETAVYLCVAAVRFAANSSGGRALTWFIDGSIADSTQVNVSSPSSATAQKVNISSVLSLTSGQYLEVMSYQNSGGNLDIGHASSRADQNEFTVTKLGTL